MTRARDRIVLALDVSDLTDAERWVGTLRDEVGLFKVGLELYTAEGPDAVRAVLDAGGGCFLDLKLHDIPATMAKAAAAAARLGATMLTVHTAAGPEALRAARDAVAGTPLQLLGVTVLTSMEAASLRAVGVGDDVPRLVAQRVEVGLAAGLDGFVCSPVDCATVRALAPDACLVVPGVRPAGSARDDQRRVATPADTVAAGADQLVLGRPIRQSPDPIAAAREVAHEIASVTGEAA